MERAGSHPYWPAHRVFRQLLLLANAPPSMSSLEYPPPHVFNFFIHNMLCFNYIANIIKLMRLLSREGMRDVDIGICWDAGYIGICGIGGEDGGYAEICGTDHLPEIGPAGLPFLDQPPQSTKDWKQERQTICKPKKKNAYFAFNLLIVNHINQYFNIRLHLIRFITYNRRIFIAKYLFENKTCSIFAYVKITLTNRRTRGRCKSQGYGQI